jgi:6-pyruvoyltetrahydropterin/6-carboxytetrahydropterin synthase
VEIEAPLDRDGLVVDFKEVKPVIRAICDELDEHWLVPGRHAELSVEAGDDGHTRVEYRGARYMAPSEEVIVLPIGNTSVENFASWFAHEMKRRLEARFAGVDFQRLRVAIEETSGQHGVYEIERTDSKGERGSRVRE